MLVLHNGTLGNKQFGIGPHVRDLFSLKGWVHFWAGGQEINTVFREGKGMWIVLSVSAFRSLLGETDASISSESSRNSLLFD